MYIYQADVWCDSCAEEKLLGKLLFPVDATEDDESSWDSDEYPKAAPLDHSSDSPCHCAAGPNCLEHEILSDGSKVGALLGTLTAEGVKYVQERAAEKVSTPVHGGAKLAPVSPCVQLWIETFDIKLPPLEAYAWPGGYGIVYYDDDTSEPFCAKCAAQERGKGRGLYFGIYHEGPTLQCTECGADMESSYGDPDAEESDDS